MNYASILNPLRTPVTEQEGSTVPNAGGGFSFAVDDRKRLDRFLILGSEGGSYYASEKKLTKENAEAILRLIESDGPYVVARTVEVSLAGRAPKNDPAIFAIALAAWRGNTYTKHLAYDAVSKVCRIGTHLFQFADACNTLRGWGGGLRRAIASWYTDRPAADLARQLVKYQSREKWSHRDLLRLSHPKVDVESSHQTLLHWAVKGWSGVGEIPHPDPAAIPVWAFERAKRATTESEIVRLIGDYDLPRECVPTQWLNSKAVWEALLERMPPHALVRNLGKMSSVGLLTPLSDASRKMASLLTKEAVVRSRLHPLTTLTAAKVYASGRGIKGSLTWTPGTTVLQALDAAFHHGFAAVEKTDKRFLLALDVSGSMCSQIAGSPLTCRDAAAAMSLVTATTEETHAVAFTSTVTPFPIRAGEPLPDLVSRMAVMPFGSTNCSGAILYAMYANIPVDVFVMYTDNETNCGVHPYQALREYRQRMGIPAKLVVVGMSSGGFSVADPSDGGMLDVVGFDTTVPAVISDFARV